MSGKSTIPEQDRFWQKVHITNECWEWIAYINRGGYGEFGILKDGKHIKDEAHRYSWELHFGMIPNGLLVCHKCDNRKCCNPHHLFLCNLSNGRHTHPESTATGSRHGFHTKPDSVVRGSVHDSAKLTDQQVLDIRKLFAKGANKCQLARNFGVSTHTIFMIVNRRKWTHI